MNFIDRYPLVVTPVKDSSRDFWTSYLTSKLSLTARGLLFLLLKTELHLSRS